jgi:hypothetical protein
VGLQLRLLKVVRLSTASSTESASLKRHPTAFSRRLFHGGGREALATYRTAAAVGKSLASGLRL